MKENVQRDRNSVIAWADDSLSSLPLRSRESRIQEAISRVLWDRLDMEKNRNGIEVDSIHFGLDQSQHSEVVRVGKQLSQDIYIHNRSHQGSVCIVVISTLAKNGFRVEGPKEFFLDEGESRYISVQYKPTCVGCMRCVLIVRVESESRAFDPFIIARYISIRAGNPDDDAILKPTSPFHRRTRAEDVKKFSSPERIERPKSCNFFTFVHPIKHYFIPQEWKTALLAKSADSQLIDLYLKGKDCTIDEVNYPTSGGFHDKLNLEIFSDTFHRLLWAEEQQMKIDIKQYDMNAALLSRTSSGLRYSLSIPGLAEGRPSVVRGDMVTVSVHTKCFQAEIYKVTKDSAILKFPKSFESFFVNGLKVDVRFHFKRLPLRTAHQAVDAVKQNPLADHILFPKPLEDNFNSANISKPLNVISTSSSDLKLFNRNLNAEQQAAVLGILSSTARPSPYIVHGPPGTGKVTKDNVIPLIFGFRFD